MNIEENDVVLCTVKRIEKTTVFLEISGHSEIEATMTFSEVSPGRIRNIRKFIAVNKKIVCKVLRIKNGQVELSLRRVTGKDRDEVLEMHKKEKTLSSILKPILKEKTQEILEKIKTKHELSEFLDDARENPKILEEFVPKSFLENLQKIFAERKEKEKSVNIKIILKSKSESGISDIKKILKIEKAEIYYLGSSTFSITTKAKDYKIANSLILEILEKIKEKAKELNATLEIKK